MNGVDNFEEIKNHAIEQSDRPNSITRKEAENLVRQVLKGKLDQLPKNIFIDSVNMLMEEINGTEVI